MLHASYMVVKGTALFVYEPDDKAATVAMPTSPMVARMRRIADSTDFRNKVNKMAVVAVINTITTAHNDVTVT